MKNFEEFKKNVEESILDYLPNEYQGAKVSLNQVTKNNGLVLTGLTVLKECENISPTVYLEGFFKKYEEGTEFCEIMEAIAETIASAKPTGFTDIAQDFKNLEFIKDKVIMVLVNAESNEELLSDVPHRKIENLALIYKVMLDDGMDGVATITIHNNHMEFWGVTVDKLHALAKENTPRLLPSKVLSMSDLMKEMFGGDGCMEIPTMPADEQMYVISNKKQVNGAAVILYDGVLDQISEKVDSDLFILPSSIHECIAVATNKFTADELVEMVRDVNGTQVSPEERLADSVYKYSRTEKKISLCA